MEIIYRSFDGRDFYTEEDCLVHEQKNPLFRMWDSSGETKNIEKGDVVELNSNAAVEKFIEICQNSDIDCSGIDGVGLYAWDASNFEFVNISSYNLPALRAYLSN